MGSHVIVDPEAQTTLHRAVTRIGSGEDFSGLRWTKSGPLVVDTALRANLATSGNLFHLVER